MKTLDIKGFENLYTINDSGVNEKTVFSIRKNSYLKPSSNQQNYLTVMLKVKRVETRISLHKLIALHFIPNPNNYTIVHHKNHNRQDNRIENLEWVSAETHKLYHSHKYHPKGIPSKFNKQIIATNKLTNDIKKYNSIADAAKHVNGSIGNISNAANGKIPSAYGYYWKFA